MILYRHEMFLQTKKPSGRVTLRTSLPHGSRGCKLQRL